MCLDDSRLTLTLTGAVCLDDSRGGHLSGPPSSLSGTPYRTLDHTHCRPVFGLEALLCRTPLTQTRETPSQGPTRRLTLRRQRPLGVPPGQVAPDTSLHTPGGFVPCPEPTPVLGALEPPLDVPDGPEVPRMHPGTSGLAYDAACMQGRRGRGGNQVQ